MPLLPGKKNIGHNIEVEESHGKPQKQAIAIALRTAGVPRKGKDEEIQPVAVTGSKPSMPDIAREVQEYAKQNRGVKVRDVAVKFGLTPEEAKNALSYVEPYHNIHPVHVADSKPGYTPLSNVPKDDLQPVEVSKPLSTKDSGRAKDEILPV